MSQPSKGGPARSHRQRDNCSLRPAPAVVEKAGGVCSCAGVAGTTLMPPQSGKRGGSREGQKLSRRRTSQRGSCSLAPPLGARTGPFQRTSARTRHRRRDIQGAVEHAGHMAGQCHLQHGPEYGQKTRISELCSDNNRPTRTGCPPLDQHRPQNPLATEASGARPDAPRTVFGLGLHSPRPTQINCCMMQELKLAKTA